jgi:ribA/ribD-fused uncharacterized protein
MRVTDTHIYFWGSFLSNWIPKDCKIIVSDENGTNRFYTSEQLFMYYKACFFGDKVMAIRIIMNGKDPKDAKDLGREVKNYSEEKWSKVREEMMYNAIVNKFTSDPKLTKQLLDTENKILVEGTPFDPIWGVKIKWDDDRILDERNWKGQNLLGKVLMRVREDLRK